MEIWVVSEVLRWTGCIRTDGWNSNCSAEFFPKTQDYNTKNYMAVKIWIKLVIAWRTTRIMFSFSLTAKSTMQACNGNTGTDQQALQSKMSWSRCKFSQLLQQQMLGHKSMRICHHWQHRSWNKRERHWNCKKQYMIKWTQLLNILMSYGWKWHENKRFGIFWWFIGLLVMLLVRLSRANIIIHSGPNEPRVLPKCTKTFGYC